eukprot:1773693-Prymnesium_polylepis.1
MSGELLFLGAGMSSTYSTTRPAVNCINGNLEDICQTGGDGSSDADMLNPWLELDLGISRQVEWIIIYNRAATTYQDRLGYHELWIGDEPGVPLRLCAAATAPATF